MKYSKGDKVWVKSTGTEWMWEIATVEQVLEKGEVLVLTQSSNRFITNIAHHCNPSRGEGFSDMTSMTHISEATILSNLHKRSVMDRPYTFMGPVMLAVNPLKQVDIPGAVAGDPGVSSIAHPFAMAENAFRQLKFALSQITRGVAAETPASQTVVVGGESGAGKTESSKMVLKHLVERCGGGSLDKRLLGNNAILESFGNAQTLRNSNSSRFGKLLKLHFDQQQKDLKISGASIRTYLLERSRVTSHEPGERGYHVFYQLLSGAGGMGKAYKTLQLNPKGSYSYLAAGGIKGSKGKTQVKAGDSKRFGELVGAFSDIGLGDEEILDVFKVVAGVLHLGNVELFDDDRPEGFVAAVREGEATVALGLAAGALGFDDEGSLIRLFTERQIKSGASASITTFNDAKQAREARDAVARQLYSRLFDYVLRRINDSIADEGGETVAGHSIGVLDIFGFESFQHNDFEQLLINYTNESLQATFNHQIFHAEAELYEREKLVLHGPGEKPVSPPKDNSECMALLEGTPGGGKKKATSCILDLITTEAEAPGASDRRFNETLHRTFRGKSKAFGKVHPKNVDRMFVVVHYAGSVHYTVGSFLSKNADSLPKAVDELFATSGHPLMKDIWGTSSSSSSSGGGGGGGGGKKPKKQGSIVAKFKAQISGLKSDLDATRCSFIRCIKPNLAMKREPNNSTNAPDGGGWFERKYVVAQLKALSVMQTAEVLKNGYPTRIAYAELTDTYQKQLPSEALQAWKGLGGGRVESFVSGLFYAFAVPRECYKLGLTRVFFKTGMLSELDAILGATKTWETGGAAADAERAEITQRFRRFFARRKWLVAFSKVRAVLAFTQVMRKTQDRAVAATKVQSWWRMVKARRVLLRFRAILFMQSKVRQIKALKRTKELRKVRDAKLAKQRKEAMERKKKAEAERRRLEDEQRRKEKELEAARKKAVAAERRQRELEEKEAKLREQQRKATEKAEKARMQATGRKWKSKKDALAARRQRQMEEMDDATDFFTSSGAQQQHQHEQDGGAGEEGLVVAEVVPTEKERKAAEALAKVQSQEAENAKLLQETQQMQDAMERELEEARIKAEASAVEAKASNDALIEVNKQWGTRAKLLEARRRRQADHLATNNDFIAENGGLFMRAAKAKERQRRAQKLAIEKRRRQAERRARRAASSASSATSDTDAESDFGHYDSSDDEDYTKGWTSALSGGESHTLKVKGKMLPINPGFVGKLFGKLSPSWSSVQLQLETKGVFRVSFWTLNKKGEPTNKKDTFVLNDERSTNPPRVTVRPARFQQENVLEIQNGCLDAEKNMAGIEMRKKRMVIDFTKESDLKAFARALDRFIVNKDWDGKSPRKSSTFASMMRSSLARSVSGRRSSQKSTASKKVSPGQADPDEEQRKMMTRRIKLVEKIPDLSEAQKDRILRNAQIDEEEEDESDEEEEMSIPVFCMGCDGIIKTTKNQERCPICDSPVQSSDSTM